MSYGATWKFWFTQPRWILTSLGLLIAGELVAQLRAPRPTNRQRNLSPRSSLLLHGRVSEEMNLFIFLLEFVRFFVCSLVCLFFFSACSLVPPLFHLPLLDEARCILLMYYIVGELTEIETSDFLCCFQTFSLVRHFWRARARSPFWGHQKYTNIMKQKRNLYHLQPITNPVTF